MIEEDNVTVDELLFKDVSQETDDAVLADKYEEWAKHFIADEGLAYEVYPDGKIFVNSYEFRLLQTHIEQSHESILDVGCGRGVQLAYWLTKGFKVAWGCDISPTLVAECQKSGIACRQLDLNKPHLLMPYLPNGFDVVTCLHTLEHLKHPAQVVKELYRIAKELVIITVPVGESYWSESHINTWGNPQELIDGLGVEQHWSCSLEQVISKPKDVEHNYSCYILVIYKKLSEANK